MAEAPATQERPSSDNALFYDLAVLGQVKALLRSDGARQETREAYESLIDKADAALSQPAESVTFKVGPPLSGDPHDYVSLSRYWWPDPSQADGLPWIRKDGQTNPDTQNERVDRPRIGRFSRAVADLGLAYHFTEDDRYVAKLVELVRVWFLDEATYMAPHLEYAQRVPGKDQGRRAGILDGRLLPLHVLDAVTLVRESGRWSTDLDEGLRGWMSKYLNWLTESSLGKAGARNVNNHGAWYLFQVVAVAAFLNDEATVREYVERTQRLIDEQIDAQGLQKHELSRTRSFFYSAFNLDPLTRIAVIAEREIGVNLWGYQNPRGGSLLRALDYLALYADGQTQWPYPNQGQVFAHAMPAFLRAAKALGDGRYQAVLALDLDAPSPFGKASKKPGAYLRERYLLNVGL